MTALNKDRATPRRAGVLRADPLAVLAVIYAGALYVLNNDGNATAATAAATKPVIGVANRRAVQADGDTVVHGEVGVFGFANNEGAGAITRADIGGNAYVVDDQTVAKTGTSIAGVIDDVADGVVWVRVGSQVPVAGGGE